MHPIRVGQPLEKSTNEQERKLNRNTVAAFGTNFRISVESVFKIFIFNFLSNEPVKNFKNHQHMYRK